MYMYSLPLVDGKYATLSNYIRKSPINTIFIHFFYVIVDYGTPVGDLKFILNVESTVDTLDVKIDLPNNGRRRQRPLIDAVNNLIEKNLIYQPYEVPCFRRFCLADRVWNLQPSSLSFDLPDDRTISFELPAPPYSKMSVQTEEETQRDLLEERAPLGFLLVIPELNEFLWSMFRAMKESKSNVARRS